MGPPDKATEGYYSRKAWGQPRKDFSPPLRLPGVESCLPCRRLEGSRQAELPGSGATSVTGDWKRQLARTEGLQGPGGRGRRTSRAS